MVNRDLELYLSNIQEEEFFRRFSNEEILTIASTSIFHQYQKGQIIFFQEDPNQYAYYLFKGLIKLEKMDDSGEYAYVDYVSDHTFFPYGGVLRGKYYNYTGYAQTDVDLMLIPQAVINDLVKQNAEQLIFMYQQATKIIRFLEKRIQMTTIPNATQKVIHTLAIWMEDLSLERGNKRIINYPMTISDLGIVAGTTRETASRVVKMLTEEKKISMTRKSVEYLDVPFFQKIIES
ncbi:MULTISPECIES: Crp/Fnr family transcriptional regulator [unclassified Jeotgalibaca]|uniref:Crp/Fnr family transcriptional regulator n=1 Tax=unclassified Jeotgalibaca TaxID=2621505 RepID=UPI003FCFBC37